MKKEYIITIIIAVFLIFTGVFAINMYKKYTDFKILSISREYNLVFSDKEDKISIPLYFEKNNSFLSKKDKVSGVSIKNENYKISANLTDIIEGETIKYLSDKYYEYDFVLSFNAYDDFNEPLFINDAIMNICYVNSEEMNFDIGNVSIYCNSNKNDSIPFTIFKLSAVTNVVNNIETIVGINLSLNAKGSSIITLNSINTKNPFYEFDIKNYKNGVLGNKYDLNNLVKDYSYEKISLDNEPMNLTFSNSKSLSIFIPLIYLNGIRYVESLSLYFSYSISGNDQSFVFPTFSFMSKNTFAARNGIVEYVYHYS